MIIEQMSAQLRLPIEYLLKVATTASHRYKEYQIPKKVGGGTRTIHHPARELKLLQGWLLKNIFTLLPVHPAATAYKPGSSIRLNAERHVANNYLLRIDFREFFPSLKGSDVTALLNREQGHHQSLAFSRIDLEFIRRLVCRFDSLTIGAPTSPCLSNAIMYPLDEAFSRVGKEADAEYTRYADDLYFSTNRPDVLRGVLQDVRVLLGQSSTPRLMINDRKTAFSSRKRRRLAAGLVLTSDKKVSIGRKKKRVLKSIVLKLKHHQLEPNEIAHLRGWISYLRSVEPEFVFSLQRKYELDFQNESVWGAEP
jgi:RNA-directed DNA polymerase